MSQVTKQEVEGWLLKLRGSDVEERHRARLVLGGLSPEDQWPIDSLVRSLGSEDDDLVFWSVLALGRLERHSAPAVEKIAAIVRTHRAFGNRQAALTALVKIDSSHAAVREAIFAALADESPFVRREALQASVSIPEHTAEELTRIAAMSADQDETVAAWSEVALRNIRIRLEKKNAL